MSTLCSRSTVNFAHSAKLYFVQWIYSQCILSIKHCTLMRFQQSYELTRNLAAFLKISRVFFWCPWILPQINSRHFLKNQLTSGGNRPTSGAKIGFFDEFCPFSFQKTFLQPPEVKLLISSLIFLQTIPN